MIACHSLKTEGRVDTSIIEQKKHIGRARLLRDRQYSSSTVVAHSPSPTETENYEIK